MGQSHSPLGAAWSCPLSTYNGRTMYCAPGTHEAAFELLRRYWVADRKICDLAGGRGAWADRLRQLPHRELVAADIDVAGFNVSGVDVRRLDLDADFSAQLPGPFDLVTAIEIIEHLENPRHFLREINDLLVDGGSLLVTTPNISGAHSRLHFLRHGTHYLFHEAHYRSMRHISPIARLHVEIALRECGFELIQCIGAGSSWGWLKRLLFSPLLRGIGFVLHERCHGEVAVFLARKIGRPTPKKSEMTRQM